MSMSVRCAGCGLEYAGARGLPGLFAQPRSLIRPRFLWMLGQVKRFHRQAAQMLESDDATTTLEEFIHAAPVHRVLRQPLPAAAGLRRLVVRLRRRTQLSGSLPVRVPAPPRHADRHRIAAVAHRRRWLANLCRAGGQEPLRGAHGYARARGQARSGRRGDSRRRRPGPSGRPGGARHPSRPGAGPAGRSHAGRESDCWVPSSTSTRPRCCTPTPHCCPGRPAPARRGTT